jgi:hypothetical protein
VKDVFRRFRSENIAPNRSIRLFPVRFIAPALFILPMASALCVLADSSTPPAPVTAASIKAQATKEAAANDAVKVAAAALEKEFNAHLADNTQPLRPESNFFTDNANPDITPKSIITALNRSYGVPASSLYVHWQLLSGISGTVDDALDPLLLSVYRNAPTPPLRPGLDPDQKSQFKQAVMLMKEADAANINAELDKNVEDWKTKVKPFTDYRDELAKKLPINFGLVLAEFRDGVQRASSGIDADKAMDTALKTGKTWAEGDDAKPDELRQLAGNVRALLGVMGDNKVSVDGDFMNPAGGGLSRAASAARPNPTNTNANNAKAAPLFPPTYFTEVDWSEKPRPSLQWKTGTAKFASKDELVAFYKMLLEQAEKASTAKAPAAAASAAP